MTEWGILDEGAHKQVLYVLVKVPVRVHYAI